MAFAVEEKTPNVIEQTKSLLTNLRNEHPGFLKKAGGEFLWKAYLNIADVNGDEILSRTGKDIF